MKKTLCALLTAALLLSSNAFASPAAENVEQAEENIELTKLYADDAELTAETSELEAYNTVLYGIPVYFDDFENAAEGFQGGVGKTESTANPLSIVDTEDGNHAVLFPTRPAGIDGGYHVYAYSQRCKLWGDWDSKTGWRNEFAFKEGTKYTFVADAKSASDTATSWFSGIYTPQYNDKGVAEEGKLFNRSNGINIPTDKWETFVYSFVSEVTGNTNIHFGGSSASQNFYIDNVGLFGKPTEEYNGAMTLANDSIAFTSGTYSVIINLPTELDPDFAAAIEKAPTALGANIKSSAVVGKAITLTMSANATGTQTLSIPSLIAAGEETVIPAAELTYTAEKVTISKNAFLYGKEIYFDDFEDEDSRNTGFGSNDTASGKSDNFTFANDNGNNVVLYKGGTTHVYAYSKNSSTYWGDYSSSGWRKEVNFKPGYTYSYTIDFKAVNESVVSWSPWFYIFTTTPKYSDGNTVYARLFENGAITSDTWRKNTFTFEFSDETFSSWYYPAGNKNFAPGAFAFDGNDKSSVYIGGSNPGKDIYIDNIGLFEMPAAVLDAKVVKQDKASRTVSIEYAGGLSNDVAASINTFGSELIDGANISYIPETNILNVILDADTDYVEIPSLIAADETKAFGKIQADLYAQTATLDETDFRAAVHDLGSGIRFKGTVNNVLKSKETTTEYGFLVALSDALGTNELAFDTSKENTPNKVCTTAEGVKFVYAQNYSREGGTNKYINSIYNDGTDTLFSAVLVNIKEGHYKDSFSVRTYVKTDNEYFYGETVTGSIYDAASTKKADYVSRGEWDNLDQTVKNAIETILKAE